MLSLHKDLTNANNVLKLGKNLSWDFEIIFIFRKNEVLNIRRYLKSFYTYKKINNIFLKFIIIY